MTDKGILFLPLKQYGDKMIGTKNNLTLKELNEVHTEGFVKQNDGKIYNMIADNETTHLEFRLKYTDNIVCLDIDGLNENGDVDLEQFMEKCPEVFKKFPYTLSRKKKLPHFYFKLDGIDIQSLKGTYVDCFNNMKADILFNHCWEKRDAEMFNYNDKEGLPFIDYEDIKQMLKPDTFKIREKPTTEPKEYNTNNKKDENILDLIDVKYWDDYESWKRLVWAMNNEGYSEETARKYSMKSSKYDDDGFTHFWEKPPFQNDLTQGTINYYAKLSDKDKYYDIVTSYTDTTDDDITISTIDSCEKSTDMTIKESYMKSLIENRTDDDFAKIICEKMKDDLVLNQKDDKLYIHYKNFWTNNENLICNRISKTISSLCLSYKKSLETIKYEYGDANYKTNQQKIKDIQKTINDMGKASKRESIIKIMKHNMATEMKNIKFDTYTPHIFCFNNIAFNLHTAEVYEPKKTDYITMKSGYDYIEPTQDDINEIDKLFDSIFPDPEVKKTYISILRTGLSGKRQENLFMANGVGRNGKGVLNELMMACVGNYGHKMNISVLVDKIKDGPNTSVNNLNMMRFVVTNEPNDNENILSGNIKRITGDMVIPARGLYSSNEDTTLNLSLVLELNKMINIKGRIDHAMISRLVSIRFSNIFTNDPDILKNNPNAYPENPKLKDPEFQNKFRHAMFKYLLNSPDELYICQACKQETMEYFKNQNEMYNWFIENYRKTDAEQSYISIKDIYNHWKESDLYSNMTKNEKRANSMKKFKQTQILENNEMRPYYIEKTNRKINGKMECISNTLFGWELIPPDCMVDAEYD